jgi:hypothetical protein
MSTKDKYIIPIIKLLHTGKACDLDHLWPVQIDHPKLELNTCCIAMYVKYHLTGF